jgi:DNA-binding XRE family transcriptional regulator
MPQKPCLPLVGDNLDIKAVRQELGLSQTELANLVGFSVRAVQSCEQGWRKPSPALEKSIILLLASHRNKGVFPDVRCWDRTNCSRERCESCITYRTGQGHLCWFLHGTLCTEPRQQDWDSKRSVCLKCAFFHDLLAPPDGAPGDPPSA